MTKLFAILSAFRFIASVQITQKWVIFRDSQASLASIHRTDRKALNIHLVYRTIKRHRKASARNDIIAYQWILGHCNIHGNTAADSAAKQAHESENVVNLPLTHSWFRLLLRQISCRLGTNTWFNRKAKCSELLFRDHNITLSIPPQLSDHRSFLTSLQRQRLGAAFTCQFLHRTQCVSSSQCHCGHADHKAHNTLISSGRDTIPRSEDYRLI